MVAGGVGLAPFAALAESLRARGVTCTLFYGARRGDELFYLDFFRDLGVELVLTTEDGSAGERGRIVAPLERRLADRPRRRAGHDLRVRSRRHAGGHGARPPRRFGRPCQVSVERIMGCGLGGCYSCVVPMRGDDGDVSSRAIVPGRARCWPPIRFAGADVDLSVRIGSLTLKNPLIAASGCFGYGVEYADLVDLSSLGGVAVKGLFLAEREGHPAPRIVETPAGMLNAIGLQGIGVHRFVDEKLPELRARARHGHRQRLRDDDRRIRRGVADPLRRRGRRRHRAEHLVSRTSRKAASSSAAASPAPSTSSAPSAR